MGKTEKEMIFVAILLILYIAALIALPFIALHDSEISKTKQQVIDPSEIVLPSPAAIQELLNRLEPEPRLKVDGKIGPLTLEKWNRVYCEVSAKKASEGFYK